MSEPSVNLRATLTNTAIDALQPGQELKDDRVPGLTVRANASGKSFLIYYRFRGQPRRPKIGAWGVISIAQARDIAKTMLASVAAGIDPSAERSIERNEPTVDDLWARCEVEHWNKGGRWDYEAKRLYHKNVKPALGSSRVRAVTFDDVMALRKKLADRPSVFNHALAVISQMMTLAEQYGPAHRKWRDQGTNPCANVSGFPKRKRRRYAKADEIPQVAALLAAEAEAHPETVAFVYLLMFSGARPTEIINALPSQIERLEKDGAVYGVLRLHGKTSDHTGTDRMVFLPPQAMTVIDRLPKDGIAIRRMDGSRGPKTITGLAGVPRKLWVRIRPEGMWIRDWRRTFASIALSNGVPLDKVGELLGHQSAQTTKIYAKLIEEEAHAAAALTGNRMAEMMKAQPHQPGKPTPDGKLGDLGVA